jgi:hypothetical protein
MGIGSEDADGSSKVLISLFCLQLPTTDPATAIAITESKPHLT